MTLDIIIALVAPCSTGICLYVASQTKTSLTAILLAFWVTYILRNGKVSSLKWHTPYCSIMFLQKVI